MKQNSYFEFKNSSNLRSQPERKFRTVSSTPSVSYRSTRSVQPTSEHVKPILAQRQKTPDLSHSAPADNDYVYNHSAHSSKPKKRKGLRLAIALSMFLLIAGGAWFTFGKSDQQKSEVAASVTEEPSTEQPQEEAAPVDTFAVDPATAYAPQIEQIIAANKPMQVSIGYRDVKTGASAQYGVGEPFLAASIGKLLTAIYFLQSVEKGEHKLDEVIGGKPASEQLQLLIEKSDNDAWTAFNDALGRSAMVTYAQSIGMTSYNKETDATVTSSDVANLLLKLQKRELLNEDQTKRLLGHMKNASEQQYIVAGVPTSVSVYHKAGYLRDRVHDAAIIDDGDHPYVLVVFTKSRGDYDFTKGSELFKQITGIFDAPYAAAAQSN